MRASETEQKSWQDDTEKIQKQIDRLKQRLKRASGPERDRLTEEIAELDAMLPPPLPAICSVTDNYDERTPIHVLDRGDPEKPGAPVGMRLPEVVLGTDAAELPPDTPQPRRMLAEQITDPANPLTARVFVNRLWAFVMGQGIVNTLNDFGLNGEGYLRFSYASSLDNIHEGLRRLKQYLVNGMVHS